MWCSACLQVAPKRSRTNQTLLRDTPGRRARGIFVFHVKHESWLEIAEMVGVSLDDTGVRMLEAYRDWLIDEALVAGGLGPAEADRVDTRHIADSLLFAVPMPRIPEETWDLGSGVGLPGIPLAILLPQTRFVLVERSGRRVDLLERALRILGLGNVAVVHADIDAMVGPVDTVVTRATLGPEAISRAALRLLSPGGFAVMGGSWSGPPKHSGWETVEIAPRSLDHRVWVLIMRSR